MSFGQKQNKRFVKGSDVPIQSANVGEGSEFPFTF